jgi:hypothetical protein
MFDARDTQFAGFAKILLKELYDTCDELDTDLDVVDGCVVCSVSREKLNSFLEPLVARRASDLVAHVVGDLIDTGVIEHDILPVISDLTAWPPKSKETFHV